MSPTLNYAATGGPGEMIGIWAALPGLPWVVLFIFILPGSMACLFGLSINLWILYRLGKRIDLQET